MHKENNNQRIFDNHGNITQSGDIVNFNGANIANQNNNLQNSENGTGQNFNGANIANQNNYFFTFNFNWIFKSFNWIFKSFNNKELNTKQFLFLLFSRTILFVLVIGFILLPLYSVNKNNISIFEFACMIIGFIFLCSWYWSKIKKEKPEASI